MSSLICVYDFVFLSRQISKKIIRFRVGGVAQIAPTHGKSTSRRSNKSGGVPGPGRLQVVRCRCRCRCAVVVVVVVVRFRCRCRCVVVVNWTCKIDPDEPFLHETAQKRRSWGAEGEVQQVQASLQQQQVRRALRPSPPPTRFVFVVVVVVCLLY